MLGGHGHPQSVHSACSGALGGGGPHLCSHEARQGYRLWMFCEPLKCMVFCIVLVLSLWRTEGGGSISKQTFLQKMADLGNFRAREEEGADDASSSSEDEAP